MRVFSMGRGACAARLTALALALTGAGCATHMRFVCPAHGGPEWRELTTAHVALRTDLDPRQAEAMAGELERMRGLLARALALPETGAPERIEVVAMATREELADFLGKREYVGRAIHDDEGRQWLLVAGMPTQDDQDLLIAHEMAHLVSLYAIPQQPQWFAEGLATYLSSVARVAADGSRAVGATPNTWILEELQFERQVGVRELFQWTGGTEPARYAAAWLLVRTLARERAEALADFERRLAAAEPAAQAWDASFPDWSLHRPGGPEALDAVLKARARDASGSGQTVAAEIDARVERRTLSAAEVHTVRLELRRGSKPGALRDELEEALREDPGHVMALGRKAQEDPAQALELSRRAAGAHPEDPLAWVLLARHLPASSDAARETALRKAVELAPDRTAERLELAWFLVPRNPGEAEILARAASDRTPWSVRARAIRAFALAGLARCDDAKMLLDRSFAMAGETNDPEETKHREKGVVALADFCAQAVQRKGVAVKRTGDRQ